MLIWNDQQMLDSVTKKRIDDLRNILVGKIPNPQSQVEQITTALIYKFMYDQNYKFVNFKYQQSDLKNQNNQ